MSRIEPPDVGKAEDDVKKIFKEIEAAYGMVPNLFRMYADFPPLLRANWEKVKAVMLDGELARMTKEAIAIVVSKDNFCNYCVTAHSAILKTMGVSGANINKIKENIDEAGFDKKELALINLARRANGDPHNVTDEDFKEVQDSGATNAEIVEALGVMELYTAFNKFLDVLRVDIDF